jgi:histidine ammonia-lyase
LTVLIASRADVTLEAVRRVAWQGEDVGLAPPVTERLQRAHAAFSAYVDARLAEDPGALLYGVTTGPADAGAAALTAEAAASRPRGLWTAASFGEPLPERVVRAIVLARLADLVDGHAGARPALAVAVAEMLGGAPLPPVPARGNGGSGEVLALGHLFGDLADRMQLEPQEQMALINGAPCAGALVSDAALAGRGRLELAERTFALSVEAIRAPLEAFAAELGDLWGDEHEAEALRSFSALLEGGAPERENHQAPVSHRVLPRVFGRVREEQARAERTAAGSLGSVSGNPVFLAPGEDRPLGALVSNGGFHNDRAHPALDALAHAWADLAQLAQRHVDKLFQHPVSAPLVAGEWLTKPLHMVAAGYAEEARSLAQTTVVGLGGFGQNDLPSPAFLAWGKTTAVGVCLDRTLAVLAAVASHALHVAEQSPPPALAPFLDEVRAAFPPVEAPRHLGPDAERLAAAFSRRVYPD